MRITISLNSTTPGIPGIPAEQTFSSFPVVIGRDPGCDLLLQDSSKYVSSKHARLKLALGQLRLEDTSSNGTYVNGSTERVAHGDSVMLGSGDIVTIGAFRLEITIVEADIAAQADPDAETIAYLASVSDSTTAADSQDSPGIDSADNTGQTTDTHPAGVHSPAANVRTRQQSIAGNPGARKPTRTSSVPPQRRIAELDNLRSAQSLQTGPTALNQPVSTATHATSTAPPPESTMNTLLKAAGLDPADFSGIDSHELAEHAGKVLNHSISSMMILLRARDELKNTMRAEMTLLAAQDNNPLRFSVSAEDSLGKLLSPNPATGFSDANTALDQALRDIKIHQLAMLEATRSALSIVLSHFDPETLEITIRENNPLTANMPLAREAKLWEKFKARYNEIKHDAMEDFDDIFGRELRKAYERSVSELRRTTD